MLGSGRCSVNSQNGCCLKLSIYILYATVFRIVDITVFALDIKHITLLASDTCVPWGLKRKAPLHTLHNANKQLALPGSHDVSLKLQTT